MCWRAQKNQPKRSQSHARQDGPSPRYQTWQQQDQALLAWAEQQWGHGLESLYLARKSGMDRVTLRMLRVSDMAFEFGAVSPDQGRGGQF